MAYNIEESSQPRLWVAKMNVTLPEYSIDLYAKAIQTLKDELQRMGVEQLEPEYSFTITEEPKANVNIVDIVLHVAVKNPGVDTDLIHFEALEESEKLIRIEADDFVDIHTGLAEWMHENDYMADGELRRIVSTDRKYLFDCPVKPAED
ncbi:MAG TPA: hypothetical protein VIG45_02190 [Erysipelothrix sp.]